jgi:uncharacterized protein (TIGR03067 family)
VHTIRTYLVAFPALTLALGTAAHASSKDGLAPLQGTWKVVSIEVNGRVTEFPEKPPRWLIKGNRVMYAGKELAVLSIDATTKPQSIDLAFAKPKRVLEGIVAVEKDTLKLCVNRETDGVKERPQDFATKDKPGLRLLVFTRDKAGAGQRIEDLNGFVGIQIAAGANANDVVIGAVIDGSPAKKAGVKKDDLLLKVGAAEATGVQQVVAMVRRLTPGSDVTLRVKRGGKEQDIPVKVGVMPFFLLD